MPRCHDAGTLGRRGSGWRAVVARRRAAAAGAERAARCRAVYLQHTFITMFAQCLEIARVGILPLADIIACHLP
jgi:hypothetical protein